MIVTACTFAMWKGVSYGGHFLYNDNTTALKAWFGACSPRKILKK